MQTATAFDRTIAVRTVVGADGRDRMVADLDASWASLRGVHGGSVAALAVRAATSAVPDRQVRTVAASFLRPTTVGPAELDVDVVRQGRSLATVEVTVAQGGRVAAVVRVTSSDPEAHGNSWATPALDRPAPWASCVPFTPPASIPHFAQADLRIDPATMPTGDADEARIAGHVRPIEPRAIDAAWLTMIGDWFPPTPFRRHQPPTGGVSIDYTVHVHRTLPGLGDGWLEGVFVATTSAGGIALERGTLATPDGLLVAETFHTRWTA